MVKRKRTLSDAGNAQQLVEQDGQSRFDKTAELANIQATPERSPSPEGSDSRRPLSSRRTAQVTCTMERGEREYLRRLAIRLSNESESEGLVTISAAVRFLIKKGQELGL